MYWSTIFEEISLVIPDNVRLTTLNCTVPADHAAGGAAAAAAGTVTAPALQTSRSTGVTYTSDDVASFMTRLGLIPQLTNIQLVSSAELFLRVGRVDGVRAPAASPAATTVTWQFTVTAQLRAYLTAPPTTTLSQGAAQ